MQKRYRIRFGHMRRVGLIEGRIKKVVRQSKPQEITNILWAYATLQLPLEEGVMVLTYKSLYILCMYVCMYVCMHARMHVRMYV